MCEIIKYRAKFGHTSELRTRADESRAVVENIRDGKNSKIYAEPFCRESQV